MKRCLCVAAALLACSALSAELPILGWRGIPPDKVTAARYLQAKDAGFTHLMQYAPDLKTAVRFLDFAEKAGIRLLLASPCFSGDQLEASVRVLKNHPGLGLYYLRDEPSVKQMPMLGAWVKRIRAVDDAHPCYVNWFGCIEGFETPPRWFGAPDYRTYVETALREIPAQLMSFDTYPIIIPDPEAKRTVPFNDMTDARLKPIWFETLETVRAFSLERKLPFWAFSLATAHRHGSYIYPVATVAGMKLQQYANLAYGAQGLQYFTYWFHERKGIALHGAPTTEDGADTYVMDRIRTVNAELQARASAFVGAAAKDVWHTGDPLPAHTRALPKEGLPKGVVSLSADGGAIVSHLVNGDSAYLMVVNRELHREVTLKATFADSVLRVRTDGTTVPAKRHAEEYVLSPGDAELFQLN